MVLGGLGVKGVAEGDRVGLVCGRGRVGGVEGKVASPGEGGGEEAVGIDVAVAAVAAAATGGWCGQDKMCLLYPLGRKGAEQCSHRWRLKRSHHSLGATKLRSWRDEVWFRR